jgi:hypothetical protein
MDKARLDSLLDFGLAYDTETHRIQPGLLSPPKVIASAAQWDRAQGRPAGMMLTKEQSDRVFEGALASSNVVIGGANLAYDMLVEAVHAARQGRDILPLIFKAYEEGRVFDVQIAEMLHAIANGTLRKDPRTGKPLTDPVTHEQAGYSLNVCVDLVLGRSNAKANDKYRESYALLEEVPIEYWPPEARVYPVDDACNTLEVMLAQAGLIARPGNHVWVSPTGGPGSDNVEVCRHCGHSVYESNLPCVARRERSRNLHDLANQCYTHFAMHLGAAWGFIVDQDAVDAVEKRVMNGRPERQAPFFDSGILRWKRERNKQTGLMEAKPAKHMAVLKTKIAKAFGAHGTCSYCNGAGRVPKPDTTKRKCGRKCAGSSCTKCGGSGMRWHESDTKVCKPCDGTGYDLDTAIVPRSDGDGAKCKPCNATGVLESGEECEECTGTGFMHGIATSRDTLAESGDEELINFGELCEDDKIPATYIPWLREGRVLLGLDDAQRYVWKNIPLILRPNVLLETGRTSYSGVVQLLPRKGGIRECIVARPGRVFCSVDYEAGELITHAQSCIWITGHSALADALNIGIKVHNAFAASMMGISYDEFQRRLKAGDPRCKAMRQAAKPGNFGFPGRMGAAKLVIQQRKQGPDTPCENGSTWIIIEDDHGHETKVRGYKGTRFCILMDGATRCGALEDGTPNMINEWKGRDYSPICKRCVECAERLRAAWLEQWPENVEYFATVKHCEEFGQPLTPEQTIILGVEELKAGEIVQHVSNRIRGGKMGAESIGNAIANGWFQGLLADATKAALRRASREMYDSSFRMADGSMSPLYGSRFILFAHDELIAELPEHCAHEAAVRLSQIMEEELKRYCPDLAPAVKAEPALMRRWYKGATPWYAVGGKSPANENDRLVPWEPKAKAA